MKNKSKEPIIFLQELESLLTTFPPREKLTGLMQYQRKSLRIKLKRRLVNFYSYYLTPEIAASESNLVLTESLIDCFKNSAHERSLDLGYTIFHVGGIRPISNLFWESVFSVISRKADNDPAWSAHIYSHALLECAEGYKSSVFPPDKVNGLAISLILKNIDNENISGINSILSALLWKRHKEKTLSVSTYERLVTFADSVFEKDQSTEELSEMISHLRPLVSKMRNQTSKEQLLEKLTTLESRMIMTRQEEPPPRPDLQTALNDMVARLRPKAATAPV